MFSFISFALALVVLVLEVFDVVVFELSGVSEDGIEDLRAETGSFEFDAFDNKENFPSTLEFIVIVDDGDELVEASEGLGILDGKFAVVLLFCCRGREGG